LSDIKCIEHALATKTREWKIELLRKMLPEDWKQLDTSEDEEESDIESPEESRGEIEQQKPNFS
jgi:hypothetical protein